MVREYHCNFRSCINPDGYSRYGNWLYGKKTHPELSDRTHGGLAMEDSILSFDLNRDWAWQTQLESQRIACTTSD
jgi:hypothetical protein